ncbi:hypothetical protein AAFF_G00438210 [Aldrovandia affinis]|uniref:Uncharacterized protein n=1 Tax=Aldrovandia affinis TaxID=143900 RepID=A0AAD7WI62_9TELE|nr:hypothetical protein AAFF_G00438210 [Aldrovandia affinis]
MLQRRFFWPGMGQDLKAWTACVVSKAGPERAELLHDWVQTHQQVLAKAYSQVQTSVTRRQARDQTRYNRRAQAPLLPG